MQAADRPEAQNRSFLPYGFFLLSVFFLLWFGCKKKADNSNDRVSKQRAENGRAIHRLVHIKKEKIDAFITAGTVSEIYGNFGMKGIKGKPKVLLENK